MIPSRASTDSEGERDSQLQIAAMLHSCGKFVNMNVGTMMSYHIIMSTEILGLSHKEREEIANIVKFNEYYLPSQTKAQVSLMTADYMKVAKLASILRLADVLDKSHRQKISDMKFRLQGLRAHDDGRYTE